MATFVKQPVRELREKLSKDKVICGLSGGVDLSVVAVLLNKAIGDRLSCIFVDNGILRKCQKLINSLAPIQKAVRHTSTVGMRFFHRPEVKVSDCGYEIEGRMDL